MAAVRNNFLDFGADVRGKHVYTLRMSYTY
jgi:hypothetical protein